VQSTATKQTKNDLEFTNLFCDRLAQFCGSL
jgi:hypothetical protein